MKNNDLLRTDVGKLFWKYLVPSISGTLVTSIYILVDTIIVGKGIGSDAVAALSIVLPIFMIYTSAGMLFGVGSAVMMSFYNGRGETDKAHSYFTLGITASLICAVVLTVVMNIFFEPITTFMGANDSTRTLVNEYGRCIVIGSGVYTMSACLQVLIRNDKSPRLVMIGTVSGALTNIVLDIVFVYGFHWGMFGAAFATIIGTSLGVLIFCTHFFKKDNNLIFNFKGIDLHVLAMTVKTGFSSYLIEISSGVVILVFNMQLLKYIGVDGVTAYSIISNITLVVMSLANGVAQAAQPIIATNYGARKIDRVNKTVKLSLISAAAVNAAFTVLGIFAPELLVKIFINPTPQVLEIAKPAITVYAVSFILASLNVALGNYFQGVIRPAFSFTVCVLRGVALNTAFVFILPLFMDINGIWLSIPMSELVTLLVGVVFFFICRKGNGKTAADEKKA